MRLDKYLCDMKAGSRSEVKEMIRQGRVRVDGVIVLRPETKVDTNSTVMLDEDVLSYVEKEYILLNKPEDVYSTLDTSPNVLELVDSRRKDLFPVGRLDKMTRGLILLTNDGEMAHRLISPKYEVEKEYYVETLQPLPGRAEKVFAEGIRFQEFTSAPAIYRQLSENSAILIIKEGKYHQVRRMFAHLGCDVSVLIRRRFSFLTSNDLETGEWRHLSEEEVRRLSQLVGL